MESSLIISPKYVVNFSNISLRKPVFDYPSQQHLMFKIDRLVDTGMFKPGQIRAWGEDKLEFVAHIDDQDIWICHNFHYTPITYIKDFKDQYLLYQEELKDQKLRAERDKAMIDLMRGGHLMKRED